MKERENSLAYCGFYCGDCLGKTGVIADAAKDLKTVTRPHVRGSGSEGFGLGLSIINRLCDRFGWQLEIQGVVGSGITLQLIFHPTAK